MKQNGQESAGELCGNLPILVVTAVKVCKQCLQAASAFGNRRLQALPELCPWAPLGRDFRPTQYTPSGL